jgi:hypothetical protein
MEHRIYAGVRTALGCTVTRTKGPATEPLSLRLDIWNHSPTGFEWGYGGSGPAQLALAILCDALGDDEQAVDLHQSFKWAIIARLPHYEWRMTTDSVLNWVREHDQGRADVERLGREGRPQRPDDGPIDLNQKFKALPELYDRVVKEVAPRREKGGGA